MLRELSGAHGYWNQGGYDFLFDAKSAHVTLEGDSVVMFQQTARDIFKHYAKITSGKKAKRDFAYLNDFKSIIGKKLRNVDVDDIETLLSILKASALFQIIRTSKELKRKDKIPYKTKWSKTHLIDIVK